MKRIILVAGAMLVTTVMAAQHSFGLQNHPASRQLKETLDVQLLWDSRFKMVILILVLGILLTWGVYLFTVYRMFREKAASHISSAAAHLDVNSPGYDLSPGHEEPA